MVRAAGSLVRWALFVVLSAWTAGCLDADPPAPPLERADGVVARLSLARGEVELLRAGSPPAPVRPGAELRRGDSLRVAPGAFAVLALHNGYLVRLDGGQTLRLAEVAVLDEPPASESIEAQLTRMTTAEERAGAERIAGWQADMQAADSVAPMAVEVARDAPGPEAEEEAAAEGQGDRQAGTAEEKKATEVAEQAPAKMAEAARKQELRELAAERGVLALLRKKDGEEGAVADALGVKGSLPGPSGSGGGSKDVATARPPRAKPALPAPAPAPWVLGTVRQTAPAVGLAPAEVVSQLRTALAGQAFVACLGESFPGAPLVRLALQVEGGAVVAVEVLGGAVTPACLGRLRGLRLAGPPASRYLLEVRPR